MKILHLLLALTTCIGFEVLSQSVRFGLLAKKTESPQTRAEIEMAQAFRFLEKEFLAGAQLFLNQDSFPQTVFGLPYQGDFVLSGFASGLAQWYNHPLYKKPIGQEHLNLLRKLILKEAPKAETFSQYNILKTLEAFGLPLEKNLLWQAFSELERVEITAAADVRRMYDPSTKNVRNGRPANYLGLAAKISSLAYKMNLEPDSALVKNLIRQNMALLKKNNGWLNDGKEGEFRFDRYHFEYIRFIYEAAQLMGEMDAIRQLQPYLIQSDRLWNMLAHPISASRFAYGRSLQNTWEDVWEYEPFMLQRQGAGANKSEKATAFRRFFQAWDFYRSYEYDSLRHYSRMLDPGRACYSYVSQARIWGYSIHALGKMMHGLRAIEPYAQGLSWKKSNIQSPKPPVFFKLKPGFGLWIYALENTRIVLPVVTGIGKPTHSDYMPLPFAEGICMPPAAIPSSHLTPTIRRNDKVYQPTWRIFNQPGKNSGRIMLESANWVSAKDTLSLLLSPQLTMNCFANRKGLSLHYYATASATFAGTDSLTFSIFEPDYTQNPYAAKGDFEWKFSGEGWYVNRQKLDPALPTGKGAFTSLGSQQIFKRALDKGINWQLDLRPAQKK